MAELATTVTKSLAEYYDELREKVHLWVDPLTTEQIWARPYPYGNSIGHLLLHLTGNLNYYIGAQIAETGYVRNRDLEFTDTSHKSKEELLSAFNHVMVIAQDTLAKQSPSDWMASYSAKGLEDAGNRFTVFLRCAA